jgi:hypothetical protein
MIASGMMFSGFGKKAIINQIFEAGKSETYQLDGHITGG